ncbi:MAG: MerR family transcriptional regulator [Anaerolineae bacterium]|nr:MerR family transcriptional regulator [Gloeobacterales cyanobacterium ES-bin-313]
MRARICLDFLVFVALGVCGGHILDLRFDALTMDPRKKGYRIGELAHITAVNPRTIDFYTREGLLEPLDRSGNNQHRYYPTSALDRLLLIKELRSRNLGLNQIRAQLIAKGKPEQQQVLETLQKVCQQIDDLQYHLDVVNPAVSGTDRSLVLGMTVEAMQKLATLTAALTALIV